MNADPRSDAELWRALWPRPKSIRRAAGELACAGFECGAPDESHGRSATRSSAWTDVLAFGRARLAEAAGHAETSRQPHAIEVGAAATSRAARRVPVEVVLDRTLHAGAYALAIDAATITVRCGDPAGGRHAFATLEQLVRAAPRRDGVPVLAALTIEDAPDFARRGVMLDVSRTKVPTLDTLRALIDELAALKINELQLYTEHTFAYPGHEIVWRDSSAYTGAEIEAIAAHCRARGIDLVPNQQSFGHMHRWLVHDRYRPLAEVPDGVEHAFSIHKEPFALCPLDPGSLVLLEELYTELLPHFSSAEFNVGLDETFDLGLGRSKELCTIRGKHRVYLEFLRAVHARVTAHGKRMQFWGDIVLEAPGLVPELPRDVIAMEWGYERGHPFDEHARTFAASGLEFRVCPGTSSWQSILGRTDNMLLNVRSAARAGRTHGASGLLVTDWGDRGHLQPWSVSWPGFSFAAGCAWNAESAEAGDVELDRLLDLHVFRDGAGVLGSTLLELGRAGDASGAVSTNGSPLFFLLAFAAQSFPHERTKELSIEGLERARELVARQKARLARARPGARDGVDVVRELVWGADLLDFACRFGCARLAASHSSSSGARGPSGIDARTRDDLRERLAASIEGYGRVWSARHRPGGHAESRAWLERVHALLLSPA